MSADDGLGAAGADLPFDELVQALRDGDGAAWERVFDGLAPRVKAALRQDFGSEVARSENAGGQAMASAFGTLYRRLAAGEFVLESWDDLAGLLIRIASRKCLNRLRRDKRYVSWTGLRDSDEASGRREPADGMDQPAPDALAIRAEAQREFNRALDRVRRQLRRADGKSGGKAAEIFKLRLEGIYCNAEIAAMVGRSERTVERAWADAVDLLRGMLDGSAAEDLID